MEKSSKSFSPSPSCVYGLGAIGAAVYFISNATGLWIGALGFLKAYPFGNKSYGKPEEEFPGYIREFGFSVAYQRFLWKGLYAELNVMPAWQSFVNKEGNKIDNGFQIFILIV